MLEWRSEEKSSKAEAAWESLSESGKAEARKAASKAMHLLVNRQRTEKELRCRLAERQFSPEAINAALTYVASFGYLDDRRYAEVYLHSMQGKKSRSLIRRELLEKGVLPECIDQVFEEVPNEEEDTVFSLLCKKAGEPHRMEEKELRRTVAFLGRKGFSASVIWRQIRRYQDGELP